MNVRWSRKSGAYLKHWMEQTNRTRKQVAEEMEVSPWQVTRFRTGALAPTEHFVGRFALIYGFMAAMTIFMIERNSEDKMDKHGRPIKVKPHLSVSPPYESRKRGPENE